MSLHLWRPFVVAGVAALAFQQVGHVVDGGVCRGGAALGLSPFRLVLGYGVEEAVNQCDGAALCTLPFRLVAFAGYAAQLVVGGLHHVEDSLPVGDVYGGFSQLFVKRGVMEQVQVLQHEQPCRLEIRMEGQHGAQLVQRVAVEAFRVVQ